MRRTSQLKHLALDDLSIETMWRRALCVLPVVLFVTVCARSQEQTSKELWPEIDVYVPLREKVRLYFLFNITKSEETRENTLLEQTYREPLPLGLLWSDRNREEFRIVNGDFSFRYRNRLMLEREFLVPGRSITPYGSVEVYHDSRFSVWNRNRLTAGVQIQLQKALPLLSLVRPRKQVIWDVYYTKQNDSRSQPHHLHALGAALGIHF